MRVVHVNIVQPKQPIEPEALLAAWPTLEAVAAAVQRAGHEVIVVQAFDRNAELVRDGVRFRFVSEPRLPGRATGYVPRRVSRAVKAESPAVIHMNGLDFARHTRNLCSTGIPVFAQDHASRPGMRRGLRRWGLARVAGVGFTDVRQATPFLAEGSLPSNVPLFSVPESSTRFKPGDQAEARQQTGVHGDPAVLWVGRLDRNKDPLTILDAIERAATLLPDLGLWCCYHESPLLAEVQTRIANSRSLTKAVHLVGRVEHDRVELLCRAADMFVLGSHYEGSGYALLEALACGTAPVVSDIPAFRALTGEGQIGSIVPVGDAGAFASAIVELAARPRGPLRRQVIAHFEERLSFDALGQELGRIYAKIVGEAG